MRNVTITEKRFIKKRKDLSTYVQNSFHMFGGQYDWITLQFKLNQTVLNGVLDKFGLEADVKKVNKETFLLKAKVKLSQGLRVWILGWGSQVKVVSPPSLVNEIKEETRKVKDLYSE